MDALELVLPSNYEIIKWQLEKHLPESLSAYNQINAHCKYGKLKHTQISVYVPKKAEYKSLVMIFSKVDQVKAIQVIGYWDANQIPTDILGKMILQIPKLGEEVVAFVGSPVGLQHQFVDAVKQLGDDFPLTYPPVERNYVDLMTLDVLPEKIPSIPPDYVIKKLKVEDCTLVRSHWLFPSFDTDENMVNRIEVLGAYGAYKKSKDGFHEELVAWTQRYSDGDIGMTRTLEEHQRKGLARAITLTCAKHVFEAGDKAYIGVVHGEEISKKFHESLGFKLAVTKAYALFLPKNVSLQNLM